MEYTVRHYIRLNGRMVTPGETVTLAETDERIARLLRLGALEPESDFQMELVRLREQEEAQLAQIDDPDAPPDDPDTPDGQDEATEYAPEIDAMDGIVGAGKTKKRGRAKA